MMVAPMDVVVQRAPPMPKAPVLDGHALWTPRKAALPSIAALPHRHTSSGRAALFAALQQMNLPRGSRVLVPTYHCPTMVAPVVEAGLEPQFYPLDAQGEPRLDAIDASPGERPRAMFVAHYFGLPRSLAKVHAWCRARDVVLVEDCAHSFFGMAGERPVGAWGDYAVASIAKFFPVPEGGLLATASRSWSPMLLQRCAWQDEVKAAWDVMHRAHQHGRFRKLAAVTSALVRLRGLLGRPSVEPRSQVATQVASPGDDIIQGCDMGRIRQRATLVARWLYQRLDSATLVQRRQQNFARLARGLAGVSGVTVPSLAGLDQRAPYVLPLDVHDPARADHLYTSLRLAGMPVYRWDRLWPGTPIDIGDTGIRWSRSMVQFLCHQSLDNADIDRVVAAARERLLDPGPATR